MVVEGGALLQVGTCLQVATLTGGHLFCSLVRLYSPPFILGRGGCIGSFNAQKYPHPITSNRNAWNGSFCSWSGTAECKITAGHWPISSHFSKMANQDINTLHVHMANQKNWKNGQLFQTSYFALWYCERGKWSLAVGHISNEFHHCFTVCHCIIRCDTVHTLYDAALCMCLRVCNCLA